MAGQVLSRAGDASLDFIVVLEGALEVVDDFAGEARIMVIQRAGGFVGELNMLTEQATYVSVMVREGCEVLADATSFEAVVDEAEDGHDEGARIHKKTCVMFGAIGLTPSVRRSSPWLNTSRETA